MTISTGYDVCSDHINNYCRQAKMNYDSVPALYTHICVLPSHLVDVDQADLSLT